MNLVTDPWLPVTNNHSQLSYISLNQLFEQPDNWLDLVLRPHERVSVMRLLICIVQVALDGPEDIEEWNESVERIPEKCLQYFKKWYGRFNLYDEERPFLQVSKLKSGNDKNTGPLVAKLDSTLAVGENSATLYDHPAASPTKSQSIDRLLSASQLVVSLITFLNYSPSGTQSSAKLDNTLVKHNSGAMDAPCTNGNMLHTFILKSNLVKTIHANLLDKETVEDFFDNWGKPVWEMDEPETIENENVFNNSTRTYLGRLTPLSRFCKLTKDSPYFIYCKGFQYSTKPKKKNDSKAVYKNFDPEPSSTVVVNSDGEYQIVHSGLNKPWRELAALASIRTKSSNGGALSLLYIKQSESFDLIVLGQVRDQKNAAKILDFIESRIHIPAFMMQSSSQQAYESKIKRCEQRALTLLNALEKYRSIVDEEWKGILKRDREGGTSEADRKRRTIFRKQASNHYWTLIEKNRNLLLKYISLLGTDKDEERENVLRKWNSSVEHIVRETYNKLCNQESPRQMRAYIVGWHTLYPQVNKTGEKV